MRSRILTAALLIGLGLPAFSQGQTPANYSDLQLRTYNAFFFRVTWLEAQADKLVSQGKKDSYMRSLVRNQVGLTAQEEAALKAVAADWKVRKTGIVSAAQALVAAGAKTSTSPALLGLRNQRDQMIAAHIDQVKTAFGPARFQTLDSFAHLASATAVVQVKTAMQTRVPAKPLTKGTGRKGN
jgi:hypothetical protein